MTALRYWTLVCDATDCEGAETDYAETTATETRKLARKRGWTVGPGGRDYCPKHSVPQDRRDRIEANK